jgi:IS5 family transposase
VPGRSDSIQVNLDEIERPKGAMWGKAEHPSRLLKWQFGFLDIRYRGMNRNTEQPTKLFALSNL